jgi:EpsI family protein
MNSKNVGYISIIALLSITGFLSINLYFQQRTAHDKIDINSFPYTVGDWKGKDIEIKDYEYEILETRNILLRDYQNSSDDRLNLFIVYSETNRSVFHPPEVCLIGSGINIADKKVDKINCGDYTLSTNKIYTEKDHYKGIALYSYKAGKLYTDNYYLQQAYFAFNQLFRQNVKGATIRVSADVAKDEEETSAMLTEFMAETARIVDGL